MNIQEKIQNIFDHLSPSQKKVAFLINQDIKSIAFVSAKKIGDMAEVSEATVHRFSQALGYGSFSEMQAEIQSLFLNNRALVRLEVSTRNMKDQSWLEKHYMTEMESIKATSALGQEQEIHEAAKMLLKSERIFVAGWRAGLAITAPFSYILKYMLGNSRLIPQGELAEHAASIGCGDLLFVGGFPRYCMRTLKIAEMAKQSGAVIIALTDSQLSPFVKKADVCLYAHTYSEGFLDSYVAPLAVMNAIIREISYLDKERVKENMTRMEKMFSVFEEAFSWNV